MDQVKIGRFIAECRKGKQMTQAQLAEKLNVTDKAISKWETGKGMPDSSIMLELCDLLGISVNELLSGELISMEDYKIKAEENFINLKEKVDKVVKYLNICIYIMLVIVIALFVFHTFFNWLYGDLWDDSKFKIIGNIVIYVSLASSVLCNMLKYEIKK